MSDSPITNIEALPELVAVRVQADQLDEERLRRIQSDLRAAAGANPGAPFALDLSRVAYISSMSLAALIRVASEFRGRQQRLMLVGLQPQVREVILVARLDRLFELEDNVETARRAVRP